MNVPTQVPGPTVDCHLHSSPFRETEMPTHADFSRTLWRCIVAGTMLTGCKGGTAERGTSEQNLIDSTGEPQTAAAATTLQARIHLTGLLLIVPPKQNGRVTNVLVPKRANHRALLGFGINPSSAAAAKLCEPDSEIPDALARGICYVDLEHWDVKPIGTGSPSTGPVDMEALHAVSVTRGSGRKHKVNFNAVAHLVHARIQLVSGTPLPGCTLGKWDFTPVDSTGQQKPKETLPFANVVTWQMGLPSTFRLEFTPKSPPKTPIRIRPIAQNGEIELILANVRDDEVVDLPPPEFGEPPHRDPPGHGQAAKDFDVFYELLGMGSTTLPGSDPLRPLPYFASDVSPEDGCPVNVTHALVDSAFVGRGVKTFACMPASAEPVQ